MLNYLTSLLPILIYIIVLRLLDSFSIVKARMLILCVCMGILACIIAALVSWNYDMGRYVFAVEELLKGLMAFALIARKRIVFFVEALVYGATIGSGFAIAENLIYLHANPDMLFGTALFRGLSTALLHMGCTSLMAVALLEAKMLKMTAPLILLPFIIHYLYNLMLLPTFVQMVLTVLSFLVIFVLISNYNERKIYQWLDHSITFDIQLLSSIRQGKLADTKAGQYLQGVKNQFQPEVFFDVICFMELYLDLVVAGKSRMLLDQEGLARPLSAEDKQLHNEKVVELKQLRKNIGKMGEYLLRPIVTVNDQDLRLM